MGTVTEAAVKTTLSGQTQTCFAQRTGYANIWMSQDGREASFNICEDYGYNANMAASYNEMVFTASLWGGGGIDMNWLDGMTGCQGDCNLASASVTFSDFAIW